MREILVVVSIAASAVLVGCAVSAGNEALRDQSQTSVGSSIVEGKSTKADVQTAFGSANKVSFTDAGLEIWNYEFDHATPQAINYVPVLNLLAHGANVEKKTLTVLFNEQGIVKKYTFAESSNVVRGGIAR
jgi:outer membrane protein assembly factor BamE (lipoprotein component of BamABCDE complex)